MPEKIPMKPGRVEVLVADEGEEKVAFDHLSELRTYQGCITGLATADAMAAMLESGLIVRPLQSADTSAEKRKQGLAQARSIRKPSGLEAAESAVMADQQTVSLKLRGPMRPEWQQFLQTHQLIVRERTGVYEWTVEGPQTGLDALADPDWIEAISEAEKPELPKPTGLETTGETVFEVSTHSERTLGEVMNMVAAKGWLVMEKSEHSVRFGAPKGSPELEAMRQLPGMRHLGECRPAQKLCNAGLLTIGVANAAGVPISGLDGAGQVLAVLDSGVDDSLADLQPAILSKHPAGHFDTDGHGTHVTGIAVGRGINGPPGVAPRAMAVVTSLLDANGDFQLPLDYTPPLQDAWNAGARVANLSYGNVDVGRYYNAGSLHVDTYAYEHPEMLFVVSAGNKGKALTGLQAPGVLGSPASAKNALTVGACNCLCQTPADCSNCNKNWGQLRSDICKNAPASQQPACPNPEAVAPFSSRGPTEFFSIKPDVVAPGVLVESALSSSSNRQYLNGCPLTSGGVTGLLSGTSMAAPHAAGSALLLRQFLGNELQYSAPSSALVKAMLIASAAPLSRSTSANDAVNPGCPDFDQGFGSINLSRLLGTTDGSVSRPGMILVDVFNHTKNGLASRMQPGSLVKSFDLLHFEVLAPTSLALVLVWTDRPGKFLQNNLQLDLKCQTDATVFLGNSQLNYGRDPADPPDVGDKVNNVEVIRLDNATPGVYRTRIFAESTLFPSEPGEEPQNTTVGAQGYALVILGNIKPLAPPAGGTQPPPFFHLAPH